MITLGKRHLGGDDNAYNTVGGWPLFYGIQNGAVRGYYDWGKNSNGVLAATTTYSTTDQVNEAANFISKKTGEGSPWFTWVAINAPHSPLRIHLLSLHLQAVTPPFKEKQIMHLDISNHSKHSIPRLDASYHTSIQLRLVMSSITSTQILMNRQTSRARC